MLPAHPARQWISLHDENEDQTTTWLFDVAFMLSNYHCIYGQGCQSIDSEPDPSETIGCCLHGAHLVDDDDVERVADNAALLEADEWHHHGRAARSGGPIKVKGGDQMTRTANGACIFLNPVGFAGGSGCALHIGAVNREQRPLDWKPAVCWQLPLRLDVHTDDYGHETVLVRSWERRDWGPGGNEFHWWCTEDDAAYSAASPVYLNAAEELTELVGDEIYARLVTELETWTRALPDRQTSLPRATPVSFIS